VTDDELAEVRGNLERLQAAHDSREWFEVHEAFHLSIFRISGRAKLTSLIRNLRLQSEPYVRFAVNAAPEFRAASIRDHQEMVAALARRDAAAIDRVVDRHLNATTDELRRLLALRVELGGVVALTAGMA
jgi:DNA-binding GntR family transcriptional regulator